MQKKEKEKDEEYKIQKREELDKDTRKAFAKALRENKFVMLAGKPFTEEEIRDLEEEAEGEE
jgi:hypothetical protein